MRNPAGGTDYLIDPSASQKLFVWKRCCVGSLVPSRKGVLPREVTESVGHRLRQLRLAVPGDEGKHPPHIVLDWHVCRGELKDVARQVRQDLICQGVLKAADRSTVLTEEALPGGEHDESGVHQWLECSKIRQDVRHKGSSSGHVGRAIQQPVARPRGHLVIVEILIVRELSENQSVSGSLMRT